MARHLYKNMGIVAFTMLYMFVCFLVRDVLQEPYITKTRAEELDEPMVFLILAFPVILSAVAVCTVASGYMNSKDYFRVTKYGKSLFKLGCLLLMAFTTLMAMRTWWIVHHLSK